MANSRCAITAFVTEGWFNDNYWALCDDHKEAAWVTAVYGLAEYFPNYLIVGLRGWDDFILCNHESRYFTVPTVPLDEKYLEPFDFPAVPMRLEADEKRAGWIKWYVKPIVFNGDPQAEENMIWMRQDKHAELVRWWNGLYRHLKKPNENEGR